MHRHLQTVLIAATCLATTAIVLRREIYTALTIPPAFAHDHHVRPDAPVLRSETTNRAENRLRHMNRLYNKMDDDLYDSQITPLFLDGAQYPTAPDGLQFGGAAGTYSSREALSSLAGSIDFDSAAGTFPFQARTSNTPLSIWVSGNQTSLSNHIAGGGYDPGLGGNTLSIDSGIDYMLDDGLVVGLGVGWGNTEGTIDAQQLRFRETNVSVAPYVVARMTDWLNLRGSVSFGQSDIRQSAIGEVPDNLAYADTLDSHTLSSSIGFGSQYELSAIPLSVALSGDMIAAREYFASARAVNGGQIAGNVASTRTFDGTAEMRLHLGNQSHLFTPFSGRNETVTMMNQNFGRSGVSRYFVGSEYTYTPLSFNIEMRGFRETATDTDILEGVRSEINVKRDLPGNWGTVRPHVMTESTNQYLELGGGLTHNWGRVPGQLRLEMRRTFSYEVQQGDFSSLVTIDFPF